jgi:RNA recognition motif-containing protein
MKKLYVGNLPYTSNEDELRDLFAGHGNVHSVNVIMDRGTGRARGFAFVEMDDADAKTAMESLDGSDFGGRTLKVNEARSREERGRRDSW